MKVLLHTAIDVARIEKEDGREINNHGRTITVGVYQVLTKKQTKVIVISLLSKINLPILNLNQKEVIIFEITLSHLLSLSSKLQMLT